MAVRQYVGARYVPRFMGTLDPTQQYEALDVVDNGSGTSYIARKIVPPGTPLTDNEYWFLYGASSGAIIQLQNDMLQAQSDISDLQTGLDRVDNRRFLIFGDSYDRVEAVGASWSDIVINRLGMTDTVVLSKSWAGFIGDGNHDTWADLFTDNYESITDPESITDVLFLGGTNDNQQTGPALLSAMSALETQIRGVCPNIKKFHIGFIGYCIGYSYSVYKRYVDVRHAYYENADSLGWAVIPNICYTMYDPRIFRDSPQSNHPSVTGVQRIADNLTQYLLTGYCDVEFSIITTATIYSGNFTAATDTFNVNIYVKNGNMTVRFGGKSVTPVNQMSRTSQTPVRLAELPSNLNALFYHYYGAAPILYIDNNVRYYEWIGIGWDDDKYIVVVPGKYTPSLDFATTRAFNIFSDAIQVNVSLDVAL